MRGRVLGVAAALTMALAACGTSDATTPGVASAGGDATASAEPSLSREERGLKWAQCMRENGIDVPDPKPGQGVRLTLRPGSEQQMEKARAACKEWEPAGGERGGGRNDERLRAMAACMRENGVENFPDPENGMMRITPEVGEDPDFDKAREKCEFDRVGPGPEGE
jgi:hypothetical protein